MIIESLALENFRQFYGPQQIDFSTDTEKNVTVIHGDNGSGKTTILNAFNWALYGKATFDKPEDLLNERMAAETNIGDHIDLIVELQFDHEEKTYNVKRSRRFEKITETEFLLQGNEHIHVDFIDVDGKTVEPKNPQVTLDQILPEKMKEFFFFDGEKITALSGEESYNEISEAIKNILGLEILERSIYHLNNVHSKLRTEQKELATEEVRKLIEEEEEIKASITKLNEELKTEKGNRTSVQRQITSISEKLRSLKGAKELQEKYDKLTADRDSKKEELKTKRNEIRELSTSKGHLAFILPAIKKANNYLEERRKRGELPSGIKEQFIDDLLSACKCICGTDLKKGSEQYKKVDEWRGKASVSKDLDDAYINTTGQLKLLINERKHFFKELRNLMAEKSILTDEEKVLYDKIGEIDKHLSKKDSENIGNLTQKRMGLMSDKEKIVRKIYIIEHKIEKKEKEELVKIRNEISKAEKAQEKEELIQRRSDACLETVDILEKMYGLYTEKTRKELEEEVGKIYSDIIRKPYWAEISADYRLNIKKRVGDQVKSFGMSTGERQVASLSFIGGLVNKAREQSKKPKSDLSFNGGIYPIVMDSPFGILDPEYREKVSFGIPKLSDQIVVLVSDTQWRGEVEESMRSRIGKEHDLIYHNPDEDSKEKFEYSEIKETV